MINIISENSGFVDSIFGNCQAPIKMFLMENAEAWEKKSMLEHLFLMGKSDKWSDVFTGLTASSGFKPVGENGAFPIDSMQEGYKKQLVYKTWLDKFAVSRQLVEDDNIGAIKQMVQNFIKGYYRTRERLGAALYAGAISGKTSVQFEGDVFDIASADGVSLFHKAHKPKVKGDTQCNIFSDAFSVDALDRMESRMQLFRGENNEILGMEPDTIVIANDPKLKRDVFAAIGADKDPVTANNGFNYQYGRWNVIISSYLNEFVTKGAAPWILMDSSYNKTVGGAVWNDRVDLDVDSYIDKDNNANIWSGYARFNGTFNDWRFACLGGAAAGNQL